MHNKNNWDSKIKNLFGLSEKSKIAYFRNPKEFRYFDIEYINPTHKAVLWGTLKKKYRNNTFHKIRVGKIKLSFVAMFYRFGESYIYLIEKYIVSKGVIDTCLNVAIATCIFLIFYQLCITNTILIWKIR